MDTQQLQFKQSEALDTAKNQEDKYKRTQALEDAFDNFVQPYVSALIEVKAQSLPYISVAVPSFCCASAWLLLTFLYCSWMHRQAKKQLSLK